MSTKTNTQSEFGKQTSSHKSSTVNTPPPLNLTLEERTPIARWIIVGVLSLFMCGILTYWINSGNPKINAAALAAITPEAEAIPTLEANAEGYAATLEFSPDSPVPSGSTMVFTSTLYRNNEPWSGAKVQLHIRNYMGETREIQGGSTGEDGKTVATFNIARIFKEYDVTVTASFFDGSKLLTSTKAYFRPKHSQ